VLGGGGGYYTGYTSISGIEDMVPFSRKESITEYSKVNAEAVGDTSVEGASDKWIKLTLQFE
jgi:hypothetical protein